MVVYLIFQHPEDLLGDCQQGETQSTVDPLARNVCDSSTPSSLKQIVTEEDEPQNTAVTQLISQQCSLKSEGTARVTDDLSFSSYTMEAKLNVEAHQPISPQVSKPSNLLCVQMLRWESTSVSEESSCYRQAKLSGSLTSLTFTFATNSL